MSATAARFMALHLGLRWTEYVIQYATGTDAINILGLQLYMLRWTSSLGLVPSNFLLQNHQLGIQVRLYTDFGI